MKLLLDHDVPDEVEQLLRYWKHDVQRLRKVLPIRATDEAGLNLPNGSNESSSVPIEIIF